MEFDDIYEEEEKDDDDEYDEYDDVDENNMDCELVAYTYRSM